MSINTAFNWLAKAKIMGVAEMGASENLEPTENQKPARNHRSKRSTNRKKPQEPPSSKTTIIVIGLVLAIVGSVIASSYAKATLTNYTGFGMIIIGIVTSILGICATAVTTISNRLTQKTLLGSKIDEPKLLCPSIWAIGIGLILTIVGSVIGSTYAKNTITNTTGFAMLLAGICVFVLGAFGTALGTLKIQLTQNRKKSSIRVEKPRILFLSILSMGIGIVLFVVGSILAGAYAKQSMMNYVGFGMLLSGIVVLSVGMSGTVVSALKSRLDLDEECEGEYRPNVILGSIWAIGIGAMLVINGSLIASGYAKNTVMNYAGFAMLLAGTGVFVYGMFETARMSAMGYLNNKLTLKPKRGSKKCIPKKKETFPERLQNFRTYLVKTNAILNLAGVMVAMGLLFFSLWQLDLIVSGPVWWQAGPHSQGWSWPGPGAYANDYFQCFLWKTTVGQAYDTLFMLIFISFIVLFASAFFWPRRAKN